MTKTFTFNEINNKSSFNPFLHTTKSNNSKTLDDIILDSLIKKNSYLFKNKKDDADLILDAAFGTPTEDIILTGEPLKKAINFIKNYKIYTKKYKLPYILGKMYTLSDGTPIVFYDDEIQIGFDTYKYADFSDFSFLNTLSTNTKKTIINIYTNGATNININLL